MYQSDFQMLSVHKNSSSLLMQDMRKKSSAVFIALRHFAGGVVVLEKTDFAGATTVSGRFTLSLAKTEKNMSSKH